MKETLLKILQTLVRTRWRLNVGPTEQQDFESLLSVLRQRTPQVCSPISTLIYHLVKQAYESQDLLSGQWTYPLRTGLLPLDHKRLALKVRSRSSLTSPSSSSLLSAMVPPPPPTSELHSSQYLLRGKFKILMGISYLTHTSWLLESTLIFKTEKMVRQNAFIVIGFLWEMARHPSVQFYLIWYIGVIWRKKIWQRSQLWYRGWGISYAGQGICTF